MSIVTKTGDSGTTALMYGKRVPKQHVRITANGYIDELNAALGMARAANHEPFVAENILATQKDLVTVMGEICVLPEDLERYVKDGFTLVSSKMTARLENLVREIEAQNVSFKGWATPGSSQSAAALDVARTVCRRAERGVCELNDAGGKVNPEIVIYLNRLSDLLWLFARWVETKSGAI